MSNVFYIKGRDQYESGYVRNCHISAREGDTLFSLFEGNFRPYLDGYAIIPIEEYERLKGLD